MSRASRGARCGSGRAVSALRLPRSAFPATGRIVARPARVGRTRLGDLTRRLRPDPPWRDVVTFRGKVEGGSSGGPLVDAQGEVAATVFARRKASTDGYAVPNDLVRDVLNDAGTTSVESECVER